MSSTADDEPSGDAGPAHFSTISRRDLVKRGAAVIAGTVALTARAAPAQGEANPFRLDGRVAIVTGAARGIGRAIAVGLASAGADIAAIDIAGTVSSASTVEPATEAELNETGELVKKTGRRFIAIKADIRDLPAMQAASERTVNELGKIDILVANAGIQIFAPIAQVSNRAWHDVIEVNLNGTANTVRAVVPHMIERQHGRIIIIASGQGRHGMKNGAAYSASKWALIGFMKSIALELAEHKITVNTIEPGLVDTALTRNTERWNEALKHAGLPPQDHPKEADVISARMKDAVLKVPWMQPADIAPAAVFLASNAAAWVSGATYDVTAGDSANYTA